MIKAEMLAYSQCPWESKIASMQVTMPRYILAEFNTHRMLSKNSASSRAIPTRKMIKSVMENPFIPIAWQKEHTGMQGFEYYDTDQKFNVPELTEIMLTRLMKMLDIEDREDEELKATFVRMMNEFNLYREYTLTEFWLMLRDKVINCVYLLYCLGVTKQLANRLLEPFMYHTVIVTGTEWENFWELRCPQYMLINQDGKHFYRSRKDFRKQIRGYDPTQHFADKQWLELNAGMADIHMMATAEAMWDLMNESTPKQLKAGEWHIPFADKIETTKVWEFIDNNYPESNAPGTELIRNETDAVIIKIATAMCARVSYTTVGEEKAINYMQLVDLHDKMAVQRPFHASPFEHIARAMTSLEYQQHVKGIFLTATRFNIDMVDVVAAGTHAGFGWSRNFKGFTQYREIIENNINQNQL